MVVSYFLLLPLKSPIKILENILLKIARKYRWKSCLKEKIFNIEQQVNERLYATSLQLKLPLQKVKSLAKLQKSLFFFNKLINLPYFGQFYTISLFQDRSFMLLCIKYGF